MRIMPLTDLEYIMFHNSICFALLCLTRSTLTLLFYDFVALCGLLVYVRFSTLNSLKKTNRTGGAITFDWMQAVLPERRFVRQLQLHSSGGSKCKAATTKTPSANQIENVTVWIMKKVLKKQDNDMLLFGFAKNERERKRQRESKKDDNESHEEAYHADMNKYTLNDEQIMRSHELYVPRRICVCFG